eukprot:225621-Prymnesium_polylepis.1
MLPPPLPAGVIAELVAHSKSDGLRRSAALVLQQMAESQSSRGKLVADGGFKAMLALTHSEDQPTKVAASWALAKVSGGGGGGGGRGRGRGRGR